MRDEQSKAAQLIPTAFPIGSTVYYAHGERLREAKVIAHAKYDHLRLRVRGVTGKEYDVDVWRLLDAMVEGFGR